MRDFESFSHLILREFESMLSPIFWKVVTALRQAMLETKEKYPQPVNWAAFTLIGEAK